ncbi:uncharacterized protein LOC127262395 [Andrographis paniculata]|uniref:uncharacterized protein LOC127262395 n=1 Tax=Andrographis paniculata TaxID=175694 RepID=UPI0021E7CD0C|nr:uncharacterized protein LOC127262395 [Andrographis paniculata]
MHAFEKERVGMELNKHFSHNHGLAPHHLPPGGAAALICGGCKLPASGNVHVCWKCSYFLHDQCFRAPRSMKHPSHPPHPLTLTPFPTYPSSSFFCNSCHAPGHGFSYTCSHCDFDLHLHCANPNPNFINPNLPNYPPSPPVQSNPNLPNYPPSPSVQSNSNLPNYPPPSPVQSNSNLPNYPPQTGIYPPPIDPIYSIVVSSSTNPPAPNPNPVISHLEHPPAKPPAIIKHFSHPHVLTAMEVEKRKGKECSACGGDVAGAAYLCTEPHCGFNLHKTCFESPPEVKHKSHLQHPLRLLAAPPYNGGFTCNACLKEGKAFVYNCAACSYDLHIDCVRWPEKVVRPDHAHALTLYYSSPAADAGDGEEVTFMCDVCSNPVHDMAWVYFCRDCNFGTHLECVAAGIKPESDSGAGAGGKSQEEMISETELKIAMLQLLLGEEGFKIAVDLQ